MLTVTPGPLTLARNETWKPSVFRPPARFVKAVPPSNGGSTLLSRPWCSGSSAPNDSTPKEPRLMPPPALGQSPSLKPTLECSLLPPMSSHSHSSSSGSGSGGFLPLSPEVNMYSNMFTQDATDERVYPLEMFLSVRRDAAHTPYGVLSWSLRQYMQIPTLKVPPHLQLSLNEGAERNDGTMRGALGCSLRGGRTRVKPLRLTHHKVMSILSRITPAKYDVLMDEMMLLPLRQVEEAELMEVCKILFEKAVQEPAYSGLYARLAHDVCFLKDGERDVESREQIFSRRFRRMLIKLCEAQFQQSLQLSPDDLVDRTTGTPLSEEDVQMKRSRLKDRLVGNIRFVAELYKIGFVTERVIDDIIRILVKDYNPDEPLAKEEVVFEVFQTLLRTTGAELKEHMPNLLAQSLGIAKTIELSHPKPRVVFLMMDLNDLNRKGGWVPSELVEQHVRHAKTTKNGKSNANSNGNDVARHNEKGSSIVPPLSPASLITPPENRKTARKSIDGGSLATPPCLLNTEYSNKSKNELNSIHPNSNTSNDIGKMHGNGFNLSIIGSSTTHSNNNNNNDNNNNNNTNDVAKLPARSTEKRWRGQHQPYSQLVLTHANNNNNNDNNNGSDIRLNSSMDSLQLNSPVHPSCGGSEYGFQCPMEARQHNIDMSNTHTVVSDGLRSPFAASTGNTPLTDATVNMKGVTEQMMALFRNGEESTAIAMLRDMELKNIVVCLTWWLRLATTKTSSFEDRKNVVPLLSSLLSTCGYSYDAKTIFSTVLEWICFDMEKAEYEKCPRMFDNIAQMILQCHLPCNDSLSHVEVVRNMMQCGLFNLLMRELTISDGSDRMVTVVKSCYPVSLQILNNLHDPDDDRQILRIAAQNRFRLLPYLLSVSSGTNNTMPGTPSMRPRIPSSPSLSLRSSSLGDSLASTGHYDPLVLCLVLPRVTEDPEFVLFRKLRDAATAAAGAEGSSLTPTASVRWHDEAVQMALSALGNKSTVCELIAIMRVVGSLLACSSVTGNDGRTLASIADVDYVVGEILSKRPGILYQGAVAMELIMYHTQTLNDTAESSPNTDTVRLRPLKRMFDQWCTRNVIHRGAVLELLDSLDRVGDVFSLYTAYHSSVSDVAWSVTLRELRGY